MTTHLPSVPPFDSRLDIFLQHRHQTGFALHVERLRSSITGSFPGPSVPQQFPYAVHLTNFQRHPVIANSIYLWASFLSRSGPLGAYEQQYLARTQSSLVDALNISQHQRQPSTGLSTSITPSPVAQVSPSIAAIDAIQASVLLARYFFATGRLHEASYHASAAADLAVQIGLHQINSSLALVMAQQQQQWGGLQGLSAVSTSALRLAPAQDAIELGERIGVFWQVYILDRLLSVALKRSPCIIDDDCVETRIDTPWPEEVEEYEHVCFSSAITHAPQFSDLLYTDPYGHNTRRINFARLFPDSRPVIWYAGWLLCTSTPCQGRSAVLRSRTRFC